MLPLCGAHTFFDNERRDTFFPKAFYFLVTSLSGRRRRVLSQAHLNAHHATKKAHNDSLSPTHGPRPGCRGRDVAARQSRGDVSRGEVCAAAAHTRGDAVIHRCSLHTRLPRKAHTPIPTQALQVLR